MYFIKHKSDVSEHLKLFDTLIRNQFGHSMKVLRVDNGREYLNDIKNYVHARGIQMQCTAPYSPQQNGRMERDNKTIVESARSMLIGSSLPEVLWAEAINTAVYTLNRTTSKQTSGSTPSYGSARSLA